MPANIGLVVAAAAELPPPVILYDTRNYDGLGVVRNEGTGGAVWDLPVANNDFASWGQKTLNHPFLPDAGSSFPTAASDFGGDICASGILFVSAIPHAVWDRSEDFYSECEWQLEDDSTGETWVDLAALYYYFNIPEPIGIGEIYANDLDWKHKWNAAKEFYPNVNSGATGPAVLAGAMVVLFFDGNNEVGKLWIVTSAGPTLLVDASGPAATDDTHDYGVSGACDAVSFPGTVEMFWSLQRHGGGRAPVAGVQWNGIIGQSLYRTDAPPADTQLSTLYDFWFDDPDVQELDTLDNGTTVDAPADLAAYFDFIPDVPFVFLCDPVANRVTRIDAGDPTAMTVWDSFQDNADLAGANCIIVTSNSRIGLVAPSGTNQMTSLWIRSSDSIFVLGTVVDATYLQNPTSVVALTPGGTVEAVAAVVASGYLTLINTSNLAAMSVLGGVDVSAIGRPRFVQYTYTFPYVEYVFVSNGSGISAVDVTTPASPTEDDTVAHVNLEDVDDLEYTAVADGEEYLFTVSSANATMGVVDISDPTNMTYVTALVGLPSAPSRVIRWGQRLLLLGGSAVDVVDISDPGNPSVIAAFSINGGGGAAIYGDLLWTGGSGVSCYSLVGETP